MRRERPEHFLKIREKQRPPLSSEKNRILEIHQSARLLLFVFILTFAAARVLVFLIMEKKIPDLYLFIGGTHVHHLNYGIFLLSAVGAYFIFSKPSHPELRAVIIVYAIGLALTFDEFGMWLHLGGGYWQRASFDAVTIIIAFLSFFAFVPPLRTWRVHHYFFTIFLIVTMAIFFFMLFHSLHLVEAKWQNKVEKSQQNPLSLPQIQKINSAASPAVH